MKQLRNSWFLYGIFLAPLLAWLSPTTELNIDVPTQVGIAVVFLITGLNLSYEELLHSVRKIKPTLYIQLYCFILFPLTTALLTTYFMEPMGYLPPFIIGTLILACLPITTTSSITFTRIVKGDEGTALFNATLSNVLGAVVTPFAIGLFLPELNLSPLSLLYKLSFLVILPLIVGQWGLKPLLGPRKGWHRISEVILLVIVYFAFYQSFHETDRLKDEGMQILVLLVTMGTLHLFFLGLTWVLSSFCGFTQQERKAILFTSPQKTLAIGIPIILIIGNHDPREGFLLLPLLLYTNVQWLVSAALAFWLRPKI